MKLIVSRTHDLPPQWDGRRVEWQGWVERSISAVLHLPAEKCSACGLVSEVSTNAGLVHPLPGETFESDRKKRLPSGRTINKPVQVPAWPVLSLVAIRCKHCGHDVVQDERSDEGWDLDPSDYGDEGSDDPRLL